MNGFEKVSQYNPSWTCSEFGPVRKSWEFTQQTKFASVHQKITLYDNLKQIEFKVDILGFSGEHYREYRVAFPLNQTTVSELHTKFPWELWKLERMRSKVLQDFQSLIRYTLLNVQKCIRGKYRIGLTQPAVIIYRSILPARLLSLTGLTQPQRQIPRQFFSRFYWPAGKAAMEKVISICSPGIIHILSLLHQVRETGKAIFRAENSSICHSDRSCKRPKREDGLPENMSFLQVDKNNVIVSTMKKTDNENSYIIRLFEAKGEDTDVRITLPFQVKRLWRTDMIEENGKEIQHDNNSFSTRIGHNAIETFKIEL